MLATGEDPGVEDPAGDDGVALGPAAIEQGLQAFLFQQGVATGQQGAVQRALLEAVDHHLPFVDAEADGLDLATAAQLFQGAETAAPGQRLPVEVVPLAVGAAADVVYIEDVDPRQPQSLQAVFVGPQDGVVAVVVDRLEGQRPFPAVAVGALAAIGREQPAHLAAEHEVIPWLFVEKGAEAMLRAAIAIEGRRVEIADALLPGAGQGVDGLLQRHVPVQPAQLGATEPQHRQGQRAFRQGTPFGEIHRQASAQ